VPENDMDLVMRAKDGDDSAFEQLVLAYQKKIYNLAYRMTSNEQDALDVSQEVFLRIYKALPLFKGQSAFSTWVYSITSNVCIDFARKQKKSKEVILSFSDSKAASQAMEIPSNHANPEIELEKTELRKAIAEGLNALSPEHREILVMREICGLSYQEICDSLDLETGTVKSRISRARTQLCAFLGNFRTQKPSNKEKGR